MPCTVLAETGFRRFPRQVKKTTPTATDWSQRMIAPITALSFSLFENKGVYALLLGSGLSSAAQIPTGWEITLDLVRRVGSPLPASQVCLRARIEEG